MTPLRVMGMVVGVAVICLVFSAFKAPTKSLKLGAALDQPPAVAGAAAAAAALHVKVSRQTSFLASAFSPCYLYICLLSFICLFFILHPYSIHLIFHLFFISLSTFLLSSYYFLSILCSLLPYCSFPLHSCSLDTCRTDHNTFLLW